MKEPNLDSIKFQRELCQRLRPFLCQGPGFILRKLYHTLCPTWSTSRQPLLKAHKIKKKQQQEKYATWWTKITKEESCCIKHHQCFKDRGYATWWAKNSKSIRHENENKENENLLIKIWRNMPRYHNENFEIIFFCVVPVLRQLHCLMSRCVFSFFFFLDSIDMSPLVALFHSCRCLCHFSTSLSKWTSLFLWGYKPNSKGHWFKEKAELMKVVI